MDRRDMLLLLGAAALAPRTLHAQSKKPVLIGWLSAGSRDTQKELLASFRAELAALGWKEGSQFVIEMRWAGGRAEQLQSMARELAAKKPALIVAQSIQAGVTAANAAPKVPIVLSGGDPVTAGLATSLAHPGGWVTGVTTLTGTITEKYLELLLAAAPRARRVGFLIDSAHPLRAVFMENSRRSAAQHSVEARVSEVSSTDSIESALSHLAGEGVHALVVMPGPTLTTAPQPIVKFALKRRWPMIATWPTFAEEGALMSYGADRPALYRRMAFYVDRILKGAKPGDLPIEQATKFELIINMKTARALKLEIPRELAVRADRVIE